MHSLFRRYCSTCLLTEEYWCPIKHARGVLGVHPRYGSFVDYGDGDSYRHDLERLRAEARTEEPT